MRSTNGTAREVSEFVEAHVDGWNHDEWVGFLRHLENLGQDASDPDGIGLALEQERLRKTLRGSGLVGLGPKRIEALTEAYATLQFIRSIHGAEIAERAGIPQALAYEIAAFFG